MRTGGEGRFFQLERNWYEKRRDNDFFTIEIGNSIFKKKSSRCDKFILLNKFISKLHLKSSMISWGGNKV